MQKSVELLGGREQRPIDIVAYDAAWPHRFEREQARIGAALGSSAHRIDHIGSTSVPGLAAKPIIDVQVSVGDPDSEDDYVPLLEATGYVLRVREPVHRMLRTPALDVHVHVCAAGGAWERRHLLFRDWLRVEPADAEGYAEVKRALAGRDWVGMNDYANAKTETVLIILERAEAWAASTSWTPA
jgi:GrpB-like predicted nucleotidyltransferase (UPF0157 family)